jgi:hypothetical protein
VARPNDELIRLHAAMRKVALDRLGATLCAELTKQAKETSHAASDDRRNDR